MKQVISQVFPLCLFGWCDVGNIYLSIGLPYTAVISCCGTWQVGITMTAGRMYGKLVKSFHPYFRESVREENKKKTSST